MVAFLVLAGSSSVAIKTAFLLLSGFRLFGLS